MPQLPEWSMDSLRTSDADEMHDSRIQEQLHVPKFPRILLDGKDAPVEA